MSLIARLIVRLIVRLYFKPAFLGRATLIPYYPLNDDDLLKIGKINMKRIEKRVQDHYQADFSYDDVLVYILARSREVDTGTRNIENILTRTLLLEMASECLARMVDDAGKFAYQIN